MKPLACEASLLVGTRKSRAAPYLMCMEGRTGKEMGVQMGKPGRHLQVVPLWSQHRMGETESRRLVAGRPLGIRNSL